jgi:hypothetical protein
MNQEKLLIQGTSVSLGMHNQKTAASEKDLKPWVLLVCGNFGFTTEQPQLVSSATIQDFIQTCGAEIKGEVTDDLPDSIEPFFVKTAIKAFSDFSEEQLLKKTPVMKAFLDAREILEMISKQKITPSEGKSRFIVLDLPASIKGPVIGLLGAEPHQPKPSQPVQNGSIADSIMSMMDIGEKPSNPLDNLISAIGDAESSLSYSPAQLTKSQQLIDNCLARVSLAVRTSANYSSIASSWYALRNLLKKIGRNKQISVYLNSSSTTDAFESFTNASTFCFDNSITPDLIVWSHDIATLSLSTIEELNTLAALADNLKSLIITSMAPNDPVLDTLISGNLTEEFEQSETWSAFQCLRNETHSRALALCAPSFYISTAKEKLIAGGAWLVADTWVSTFLEFNTPFNFSALSTTEFHDDQLTIQVAPHKVKKVSQFGLTFAKTKTGRIILSPRVVFNSSEDESYGFIGFNLLVNRTIRLTGEFLSFGAAKMPIDKAAEALQLNLVAQLDSYNILSSSDSLTVQADNQEIRVAIHSDSLIEGNSVNFEFSFDY